MSQKGSIRVYILARELDMESKDLLDLCARHNIDVKNQLSSLTEEQRDQIVALTRKGGGVATAAPPVATAQAVGAPRNLTGGKVRTLPPAAPKPPQPPAPPPRPPVVAAPPPAAEVVAPPPAVEPPVAPAAKAPPAPVAPVTPPAPTPEPPKATPAAPQPVVPPAPPAAPVPPSAPTTPKAEVTQTVPAAPSPAPAKPLTPAAQTPPPPQVPPAPPAAPPTPQQPTKAAEAAPPAKAPEPPPPAAPETPRVPDLTPKVPPTLGPKPVRDLNQPRQGGDGGQRGPKARPMPRVVSRQVPSTPQKPKQEPPKAQQPVAQTKLAELPPEIKQGKVTNINVQELLNRKKNEDAKLPTAAPGAEVEGEEDDDKGAKRRGAGGGGTGVGDRQERHKKRAERAQARQKGREGEVVSKITSAAVLDHDVERHRKDRNRIKPKRQPGTLARKGKVPIILPITVRSLCEAAGMKSGTVLFKLRDLGVIANINSTLDSDLAETLALEHGVELDIKKPLDVEEQLMAAADKPSEETDLVPRAPVVAVMGHVDHGKTSLLDKIRQQYGVSSDVVSTEAGGITQVIRAWRVEKDGKPITFLDTPGHEAFTKMRARGANVTDIAVIVVAADDGVMPQTEEAISHAKAAGVQIVVAINKVDLPNANLNKTRQQLYSLNVLPDNMGGDSPFIETSAHTGKGIDELLESLALVAELKELKANPNRPARGTCLEAHLSEGEGVMATLLVQEGTLRKGDVILCGATHGRVRNMYNDMGRSILEAGPSVPVRVTGLDAVPNADDPFMVVAELSAAREIAEKRQAKIQESMLPQSQRLSLETLGQQKVTELKVILKADARGSIEAIRKELEKLVHEEVRVRLLHAAIGGITESDVQLALTSLQDTMIVGFNAVPDDRALALAEERGVQIRQYDIIYNLTDDIKAALEGKLKPREEVVHLGRAVVRETFKISRVGTIAGCHVTQGTIERSAKVRVIRNGIVIYPPADRTVGLESLKRFKDDAKEVRAGLECGIKIAGYDDIKVDDVIEAYRVDQVQRTL